MGWRASCECELAKARLANRGLLAAQVAAHRMQYFRRSMRGSYRSQVEKCQMFFPPLSHTPTLRVVPVPVPDHSKPTQAFVRLRRSGTDVKASLVLGTEKS